MRSSTNSRSCKISEQAIKDPLRRPLLMYPSETYQAVKARKLRWLRKHATVELILAYETDQLSFRETFKLAHLPARQQRASLARQQQEVEAAQIAARTIEQILAAGVPIRLGEIADAIRVSIPGSRRMTPGRAKKKPAASKAGCST